MGKKIRFLGLAFAVAMLTLPSYAQHAVRKNNAATGWFITPKPLTPDAVKAAKAKALARKSPLKAAASTGEIVDDHGIITSPAEGEMLTYLRSGYSYYSRSQQVAVGEQYGTVTIVECSDGTVYIKDPLAYNPAETWVKGHKDGNTITVPTKQPIFYSTNSHETFSLRWGLKNADGTYTVADDHAEAFTFTIEGNTIRLEGTSADGYFMGQFYDDEYNTFSRYGDFETVWTKLVVNTQIDQLPYAPSFSDIADQSAFTILDVNNDGSTWKFNSGGYAQYSYNGSNPGDDWLITPAIKLEKGKAYRLAFNTWASYYPERIEVKMGADKTAEAMTQSVIAPTDVTWKSDDIKMLENKLITVDADGYYYFGLHAISDKDEYFLHVNDLVVEESASLAGPDAVTNLTVVPTENKLEATISFVAPTKTVAGNDLTENLTKVEILREGSVIKTFEDVAPGTELSYVDNDRTLTIGAYSYQVVAYNAAGKGLTSDAVTAHISVVFEVPYVADFSNEETFNQFQVIDANNDHATWKWEDTAKYAFCEHHDTNAANDYLVSLPIHLEARKHYVVTANVNAFGYGHEERFEVVLGRAAAASSLTMTLIQPTVITSEFATDYEATFTVPVEGNYYIAIHGISDAAKYFLVAHSLSVTKGVEPTAPAAVSDFTATAGAQGALEANLAFTTPTKTAEDNDLEGTMSVDIYRNGNVVKTFSEVAPNTALSWKDENVGNAKTYAYQVVASNASGAGVKSETVEVYVGYDVPAAVENVVAHDQFANILFSWDAVGNVGPKGNYVDPALVTYKAWTVEIESYMNMQIPVLQEMIGEVTGQTSLAAPYNTMEGAQTLKYFAIQPTNKSGEGEETYTAFLVGKPYALPFAESFQNQALHYFWSSNADLLVSQDAADADGVALELLSEQRGSAYLESGKIDIKNTENPTLLFNAKGSNISVVSVLGAKDGGEFQPLQVANLTNSYNTFKVSLANLKDAEKYVQFRFLIRYMNPCTLDEEGNIVAKGDFVTMDNIRVVDLYDHDVEVALDAPASVVAGQTAKVKMTVKNNAENTAAGLMLTLTAGQKELLSKTFEAPLAAFSSTTVETVFPTSVFDEAGDVVLKAEVNYANDLNQNNNTDESVVSVVNPAVSAPADLLAQQVNDSTVTLSWSTPVSSADVMTESFEDGFGGFTMIDADGDGCNWNHHVNVEGQGGNYSTTTGNGSIYSESYSNDTYSALTPDNWLVTPAAKLTGEFKFWACGQDKNYADEHFAVFVSTTSATDPAAFTKVSDEYVATSAMKEYTVDLSAYNGQTGYIAIRHYNISDKFCLVVDDVTYTPADFIPVSYNIYVDADQVANVAENSADLKNLTSGNHVFAVTAVYANGVESKPVMSTLDVVNAINDIMNNGKSFTIYTLDGKLINRQTVNKKGVYIINNKKVVNK